MACTTLVTQPTLDAAANHRRPTHRLLLAATLVGLGLLTGCQSIQRGGANIALGVVERNVVPPVLAVPDLNQGCTHAMAMGPLISSFRSFYGDPSGLESILATSASLCADNDANAEELRYLRAQRDRRTADAQDARTNHKRLLERSARRQLAAYVQMRQSLEKKYRFQYGETCPKFRRKGAEFDQLIYLLGTISGLQAMVNDVAAQKAVNVPTDIPLKAEFAMTCLDDTKWWGTPQAVRATVWSVVPGASEGKDVSGTFNRALTLGEQQGVRLPHVLASISAGFTDDKQRIREVVKRFAAAPNYTPNAKYRYIDEAALAAIQQLSDRDWTMGTGSRTPVGGLGTFWDEKKVAKDTIDASEFLK